MVLQLLLDEGKSAEEQRESEYKLRQIIDTVPSLLWSTDATGEPTYVNQRVLDYSGMKFEDFKHLGWERFIHPADFPETVKSLELSVKTGAPYDVVHRLRRAERCALRCL
jgi:PAS domain S-box-containing protein